MNNNLGHILNRGEKVRKVEDQARMFNRQIKEIEKIENGG